jgi:hypothetical protein
MVFSSKTTAKNFFRSLRDRYADNVEITGEDSDHLHALIACHSEAAGKIGSGIRAFSVSVDEEFGSTRHFVIRRTDGSSTDFSFLGCIDGRNPRRDRLEAMRRAVEDQIITFRDSYFAGEAEQICPLRHIPITPVSYHVDHAPPEKFMALAERWFQLSGLVCLDVKITPPGDNQIVARMTDPEQTSSWVEFHRAHAVLRMLSPLGNLSDANRRTRPGT